MYFCIASKESPPALVRAGGVSREPIASSALGCRQVSQQVSTGSRDVAVGSLAAWHGSEAALLDHGAAAPGALALERRELGRCAILLLKASGADGRERRDLGAGCRLRLHLARRAAGDPAAPGKADDRDRDTTDDDAPDVL